MLKSIKLRNALEMSVNDMNSAYDENEYVLHRFSWRYKQRKRAIIKAYQQSLNRPQEFESRYRKISFRQRLRLAILVAVTAALLTGAGVVVTYYIGGIRAEQQSTHTDAFAMDWENAPLTLEKSYRITYDLSDYTKEIIINIDNYYWEAYTKGYDFIDFTCSTKEMFQNSRLNTEGTEIEIKKVKNCDALYFQLDEKTKCLIWDNGEYIFELHYSIEDSLAMVIATTIAEQ